MPLNATKLNEVLMTLVEKLAKLIDYFLGKDKTQLEEIASLKEQLAAALADDAADDQAVADAQAAATEAQAKVAEAEAKYTELQALADADVAEDSKLSELIDSVLPVEEPPVEEAPVEAEEQF